MKSFRTNLVAGALALAPLAAVVWILLWFWNLLLGLSGLLPAGLHPKVFLELQDPLAIWAVEGAVTLVLVALLCILVSVIGLVSRNYLGSRIMASIAKGVAKVPVLSTVYSTLEQLLKTFASGQAKNFRRVVQIEYPRKGLYALAFVTGERNHGELLNVYVPTTPNPTSGFYLTVAASEAHDAKMSVEEALKEIISMGIVQKS